MSVASGGIFHAANAASVNYHHQPPPLRWIIVMYPVESVIRLSLFTFLTNAMRPDTVNFRFHPSTEQALKDARTTFNSQKILLWRAVLKSCVFGGRFHRVRMDAGPIWRRKNIPWFSNENGYNWTSPTRPMISTKDNIEPQHAHEFFTPTSNWFWIELWNKDITK